MVPQRLSLPRWRVCSLSELPIVRHWAFSDKKLFGPKAVEVACDVSQCEDWMRWGFLCIGTQTALPERPPTVIELDLKVVACSADIGYVVSTSLVENYTRTLESRIKLHRDI